MTGLQLVGVRYRHGSGAGVGPVDLSVPPGQLVVLTGPSGSGKSTLARLATGLLVPADGGACTIDGRAVSALSPAERARSIGFVAQEPDDTVIRGSCVAEAAFAVECAGFPADEVRLRAEHALASVGLLSYRERPPWTLSGGQRQRLAIAAAIAAGARVLVLDEPLAQLDPRSARSVLARLRALADAGVAVLLVEHRLALIGGAADRVVLLVDGAVHSDPAAASDLWGAGVQAEPRLRLTALLGQDAPRARVAAPPMPLPFTWPVAASPDTAGPLLSCAGVGFSHLNGGAGVEDVSLDVSSGMRLALVGPNGAGKSTLLGVLAGRLRPREGRLERRGRSVEVPQDPDLALFCETVRDELAHAPRESRATPEGVSAVLREVSRALDLDALLDRPPHGLSRGQRLRVAVGAALSARPEVLLLDEPTNGQDALHVEAMLEGIRAMQERGRPASVVLACHDLDVVLRHATHVAVLHEGRVCAVGAPLATLVRAVEAGVPLDLPELASLCVRLSVPYGTPEQFVAALSPEQVARVREVLLAPLPDAGASGSADHRGIVGTGASVADAEVSAPPSGPEPGWSGDGRVRVAAVGDPRARILLVACAGVLALCLEGPLPLGACAAAIVLAVLAHPRAASRRGTVLLAVAVLVWTTVLSQGLFWTGTPRTPALVLSSSPRIVLWHEGIRHGAVQSMRLCISLSAGFLLAATTSADRLVSALRWMGVPHGLALMATSAARFVPVIAEEVVVVRRARAARGRPLLARSPWEWLALEAALLRPLAARALRRARTLADSLDVRGFRSEAVDGELEPLRMRIHERMLVMLALAVVSLAVVARVLYVLYGREVLYLASLRPLYAFVRTWM